MNVTDWQSIVDKHGGLVWQTAYRLLGNEADAADCFQEAFVSALEYASRHRIQNYSALLVKLTTLLTKPHPGNLLPSRNPLHQDTYGNNHVHRDYAHNLIQTVFCSVTFYYIDATTQAKRFLRHDIHYLLFYCQYQSTLFTGGS